MAWLDFFRRGRKKEEDKLEEAKRISFQNLNAEIEAEVKSFNERIQYVKQQIRQSILQLISELREHISSLKNINLDEKKEPERLKFIVKENLHHYNSYLQKLADELENLAIDKDYLEKISLIFENFKKNSINAFEKATILIGKEMDDVKNSIKTFSENFNSVIIKDKDAFEREKTANQLKNLMLKLKDEKNAGLQIENSLQNLEENLKGLEKQKQEREKKLEEIKNSSEYKELLKEKEELSKNIGELDKEIFSLKQELDLKYLSKYFHYDKKKSQILKEYIENFKSALENDDNLQVVQIIKEIRPDFDSERIKEIKLKAKEFKGRQETPIEARIKGIEDEIKRLSLEIQSMQGNIEQEKSRMAKFNEKARQTTGEIENQAKLLWGNVEIN